MAYISYKFFTVIKISTGGQLWMNYLCILIKITMRLYVQDSIIPSWKIENDQGQDVWFLDTSLVKSIPKWWHCCNTELTWLVSWLMTHCWSSNLKNYTNENFLSSKDTQTIHNTSFQQWILSDEYVVASQNIHRTYTTDASLYYRMYGMH